MARRHLNVECYYREHTCQGTSWTCRRCKEKFCSETHWHISDGGQKNVVCAQCEREEKTKPREAQPMSLPPRISVIHNKDGRTTEIKDEATGQVVMVQTAHMSSIRKLLVVLFDETAQARWLYDLIANPDTGLDGHGLTVDDERLLIQKLTPPGMKPSDVSDDYDRPLY